MDITRVVTPLHYRSIDDLNEQIVRSLGTISGKTDLIVGIPRSGMLVANLLSLHLNLPMTDIDGLITGRVLGTGNRYQGDSLTGFLHTRRNILVVDDSVCSGTQIAKVKSRLIAARLAHRIRYGAIYITPEAHRQDHVDWFCEILPNPRVFEWNVMHSRHILAQSCMDIDGVLCRDPSEEENDDGPRYTDFLTNADPHYLPTYPVHTLVTCRLEKYRKQTELWLARHGVQYSNLVMMEYPDMAARKRARAYARFKADAYLNADAGLFIESSPPLAARIAELTHGPVFCIKTRRMHYPGGLNHRTLLSAGISTLSFEPNTSGGLVRQLGRALRKTGGRAVRRAFNRY